MFSPVPRCFPRLRNKVHLTTVMKLLWDFAYMCQSLNTGESNYFYFGIGLFICIGPLTSEPQDFRTCRFPVDLTSRLTYNMAITHGNTTSNFVCISVPNRIGPIMGEGLHYNLTFKPVWLPTTRTIPSTQIWKVRKM